MKTLVRSPAMIAITALALLAAGGCSNLRHWWHSGWKVGPNYAPPPAPVAADWIDAANPQIKSGPLDDCAWWTLFDDAALNGLIETASRQNLSLQIAGTRILEARAQRNIA